MIHLIHIGIIRGRVSSCLAPTLTLLKWIYLDIIMHLPGNDRLFQAGRVYRGQNANDKDINALIKVKIFPVRLKFARLGDNFPASD